MSDTGITYVAYGRNYNYQGAFSARSVRALCDLPICVYTNVDMHSEWAGIANVNVIRMDAPNEANRAVKTRLDTFSPFDRTLYLDTDTLVMKGCFTTGFDALDKYDFMAVPERATVTTEQGVKAGTYWKVHVTLGYKFPLVRPNGGAFFFRKGVLITGMFSLWNACWAQMGSGRDMPALAWALQQLPALKVKHLRIAWNTPHVDEDTIIAHAWGAHRVRGIPNVTKFMTDMHGHLDWRKVPGDVDMDVEAGNGA